MNKIILQLWEESERGWGIRPDGCSIHIDSKERKKFLSKIYKKREIELNVPDEYDRIVGEEIEAFVNDNIYEKVKNKKSIKLSEIELNNLIKLEEIIFKP